MNIRNLSKKSAVQIAVMAAMTVAGSAQAFTIDSSHQKVLTIKPGAQTAQVPQVPTVQPQSQMVSQRVHMIPSTNAGVPAVQYSAPVATYQTANTQATKMVVTSTPKTVVSPAYTQSTLPPNAGFSISSSVAQGKSFDQLALSTNSSAVAVVDLQSGNLIYSKNIDATRSIASISKVMTAMVILDAQLDMREEITLIASDLVGAKKASTNLKAGDRLSRSEFVLMMLMKSENPAAKALARTYPGGYDAFIQAMNAKAASLGMYQTSFSDSSGLDPRNVSSAGDLLKMMKMVSTNAHYSTIRNFSTAKSYDFNIVNYNSGDRVFKANNTSQLVRAGSYPIGMSKTGFIREAGYCVVMETHVNNKPAVIVLLGASASQNRWNDAQNILTQLAYR